MASQAPSEITEIITILEILSKFNSEAKIRIICYLNSKIHDDVACLKHNEMVAKIVTETLEDN